MEKKLRESAKSKIIVDLSNVVSLRKSQELMNLLSPYVGYFRFKMAIACTMSLAHLYHSARVCGTKIMLDLGLNDDPEQMSLLGELFKKSEAAMVSVHCSSGKHSLVSFIKKIKENPRAHCEPWEQKEEPKESLDSFFSRRPLVFGITIPPHLESCTATMSFGNLAQRMITFSGLVQTTGMDGMICTPNTLKSFHNSDFKDIKKIVTDVVPESIPKQAQRKTISPSKAINDGADYLIIRHPIIDPPEGSTAIDEASRILTETAAALTKNRK